MGQYAVKLDTGGCIPVFRIFQIAGDGTLVSTPHYGITLEDAEALLKELTKSATDPLPWRPYADDTWE